ncbi:MAG: hypothetical protein ACYS1C_07230, partial [Planctomycetota bacterium]
MLGEGPEEVAETGKVVRACPALEWLNETWRRLADRLGRLTIPDDPYYAEAFVRLAEQGRGWLSPLEPRRPGIRSSYLDNVPPEPYGRGLGRFPNASRVTHSLTNVTRDL